MGSLLVLGRKKQGRAFRACRQKRQKRRATKVENERAQTFCFRELNANRGGLQKPKEGGCGNLLGHGKESAGGLENRSGSRESAGCFRYSQKKF